MKNKTKATVDPEVAPPRPTSPKTTRQRGVDGAPTPELSAPSDSATRSGEKSATEQYEDADLEERTPG